MNLLLLLDKYTFESKYDNGKEDDMKGDSLVPPEARNPMYEFTLYPIDNSEKVNAQGLSITSHILFLNEVDSIE